MKCDETSELIVPSIDGELSREEQEAFEAHLSGCPACRQEREALASFMQRVDGELAPLRAGMDEAREAILDRLKQPTLSPRVISRPGRVKSSGSIFRHFDVINGLVAAYAGARRMFVDASPKTKRIPLAVAAVLVAALCLWIAYQISGVRYPVVESVKEVTVEYNGMTKPLHKGQVPPAGARLTVGEGGSLLLELAPGVRAEAGAGTIMMITDQHGLAVESGEVRIADHGRVQVISAGETYEVLTDFAG